MKKTSKIQRAIERLEAKDTLDLTLVRKQHEEGARAVMALINNADVPDFISDRVIDIITKAGMKTNCETPDEFKPGKEQIKQLADLFAVAGGFIRLEPAPDSIEAFAFHFSEVLRIARTADFISTDLSDALHDASNDFITNELLNNSKCGAHRAEFISFALAAYAAREKGDE
jgi:hypothetical protein